MTARPSNNIAGVVSPTDNMTFPSHGGGMTREFSSYHDGDDFVHATTYENWVSIQTCSRGIVRNSKKGNIHLSRLHSTAPAGSSATGAAGHPGGVGTGGVKIPGVDHPEVLIYVDKELAMRDGITFEPATAEIAPDDDGQTFQTTGPMMFVSSSDDGRGNFGPDEDATRSGGGRPATPENLTPTSARPKMMPGQFLPQPNTVSGFIPKAYFSKVVDRRTGLVLWENEELKKSRMVADRVKRIPRIDVHTHILPRNLDICKEFGDAGYIYLQQVLNEKDATGPPAAAAEGGKAATPAVGVDLRLDMMKLRPAPQPPEHFRQVSPNCYCGCKRVGEMDDTGVDVQVLSTVPVMFGYWQQDKAKAVKLSRYLNDDLAQTVALNPRRFIGLGTVPMQFPDECVKELERCMKELKFRGVQIGTHVDLRSEFETGPSVCWELSDPLLEPFWSACESLGASVFIHPWDMLGAKDSKKYWLPWLVGMPAETSRAVCHVLLSALLDRHPKLRLCFAHGGGSFPFTAGRINHGFTCRPDLCAQDAQDRPLSYLAQYSKETAECARCESGDKIVVSCQECRQSLCSACDELLHCRGSTKSHIRVPVGRIRTQSTRFWVDSLVHDSRALKFVADVIGEDRVVLGSDYPFPLGEWHPGEAISISDDLTFQAKQLMLSSNACDFLGIKMSSFVETDKEGLRKGRLGLVTMAQVSEEKLAPMSRMVSNVGEDGAAAGSKKRPRED